MDDDELFANIEAKTVEVWEKQKILNSLLVDKVKAPDLEIATLVDHPAMKHFPSGILYSPMILGYDREVEDLINEIKILQHKIDIKLKFVHNNNVDHKQNELSSIRTEVESLESILNQSKLESVNSEKENKLDEQMYKVYETEISRYNKVVDLIQQEIGQIMATRKEAEEMYSSINNEIDVTTKQLQTNNEEISSIRNDQYKLLIDISNEDKKLQQLKVHNFQLRHIISEMETGNERMHKKLEKLEQKHTDHQKIVLSFEKIQEIIEENAGKQGDIHTKMVEALVLCETQAAEVRHLKTFKNRYLEELKHIETVIQIANEKLNNTVQDTERLVSHHYVPIINKLDDSIHKATAENTKLQREMNFLSHQIEVRKNKMNLYNSSKNFVNQEELSNFLFNFVNKSESIYEKLNKLSSEIRSKVDDIKTINPKIESLESSSRENSLTLDRRRQRLEVAVRSARLLLKNTESRNIALSEGNDRIKSYLKKQQKELDIKIHGVIDEKEREIQSSRSKLNTTIIEFQKEEHEQEAQTLKAVNNLNKVKRTVISEKNDDQNNLLNIESQYNQMKNLMKELYQSIITIKRVKNKSECKIRKLYGKEKELREKLSSIKDKISKRQRVIVTIGTQIVSTETRDKGLQVKIDMIDKAIKKQIKKNKKVGLAHDMYIE